MIVPHFYMGPVPAFIYAAGQLMDYGVHTWDIREGQGKAHALPGDVADLLVPFMFIIWQSTIRPDADRTPLHDRHQRHHRAQRRHDQGHRRRERDELRAWPGR